MRRILYTLEDGTDKMHVSDWADPVPVLQGIRHAFVASSFEDLVKVMSSVQQRLERYNLHNVNLERALFETRTFSMRGERLTAHQAEKIAIERDLGAFTLSISVPLYSLLTIEDRPLGAIADITVSSRKDGSIALSYCGIKSSPPFSPRISFMRNHGEDALIEKADSEHYAALFMASDSISDITAVAEDFLKLVKTCPTCKQIITSMKAHFKREQTETCAREMGYRDATLALRISLDGLASLCKAIDTKRGDKANDWPLLARIGESTRARNASVVMVHRFVVTAYEKARNEEYADERPGDMVGDRARMLRRAKSYIETIANAFSESESFREYVELTKSSPMTLEDIDDVISLAKKELAACGKRVPKLRAARTRKDSWL